MTTMAALRGFALPYLKAWRRARLMTQRDLVEQSGVSIATIVRAEGGDTGVSLANVRKLAAALDVTPEQLVNVDPEREEGTPTA